MGNQIKKNKDFFKKVCISIINEIKQLRLFILVRCFVRWVLGYCPRHGWGLYPKRYRKKTTYVDEESNYETGCKYCQQESNEYYEELWDDYYRGRL